MSDLQPFELEWCRCGHRRIFIAHEHWFLNQFQRRNWWATVPPHRFNLETSKENIKRFEDLENSECDCEEWVYDGPICRDLIEESEIHSLSEIEEADKETAALEVYVGETSSSGNLDLKYSKSLP